MPSPFRVGGPVTGEFFTDRAEEVEEIYRAMRSPTRLLVRGHRRQGKTSAIAQAARRLRAEGGVVLWADLATVARLSDLRDRLLSSLPPGFFGTVERLKKLDPVLEVLLDPATGHHTYRFRMLPRPADVVGVREQTRLLVEAIDEHVAETSRPLAVVLDEVQAVTLLDEERVDWFLRDLMQSAAHLSFICAGSQPSLLRAVSEERHSAFFRFFSTGPTFGAIEPEHLSRWIASRLTSAGVRCSDDEAGRIVAIGDRTQDVMQLADAIYAAGEGPGRVDAGVREAALSRLLQKESARFLTLWSELTSNQRVVARALASGATNLYAQDTGLPVASSSIHRSVEGLRKKGLLVDAPGRERLDDPFFGEWILRFAMADSVPEGVAGDGT
jgi:hypothetical protein